MSYCRVCGTEDKIEYRDRSRMVLCDSCHEDTPRKVGFSEFMSKTFLADQPDYLEQHPANARLAREFYDDYKHSSFGDPVKYWASCTS